MRKNCFLSKLIRRITKAKWSHVAIYLGEGQVIDTDALRRVGIYQVANFEEFQIMRYEQLTDKELNAIVTVLIKEMNKPYDYVQIFGFFVEHILGIQNKWSLPDHYTCGDLVDTAFREAGIDLLPNKEDGDVTPGDLFQSSMLKAIGEEYRLCYNK